MNLIERSRAWQAEKHAAQERRYHGLVAIVDGAAPLTWATYAYVAILDAYPQARGDFAEAQARASLHADCLRALVMEGRSRFPHAKAGARPDAALRGFVEAGLPPAFVEGVTAAAVAFVARWLPGADLVGQVMAVDLGLTVLGASTRLFRRSNPALAGALAEAVGLGPGTWKGVLAGKRQAQRALEEQLPVTAMPRERTLAKAAWLLVRRHGPGTAPALDRLAVAWADAHPDDGDATMAPAVLSRLLAPAEIALFGGRAPRGRPA